MYSTSIVGRIQEENAQESLDLVGDFPTIRAVGTVAIERDTCTDADNADRFIAQHGEDVRYCRKWKAWMAWDGSRWVKGDLSVVMGRAIDTARSIYQEASCERDNHKRSKLIAWATTSHSRRKLEDMLALASHDIRLSSNPAEFDSHPWLFNCRNGTIDLRTGTLRPHCRADMLTKICQTRFNPDAHCPKWIGMLDSIFHRENPDASAELKGYWKRLCGYLLYGGIREHVLAIVYGEGGNGKTTIINSVSQVMGSDYSAAVPPSLLIEKKSEGHPTDRMDLCGMRFVHTSECGETSKFNEPLVKQLTGNDVIKGRRMYEDFWEFKPTHKILITTNHLPEIKGTDDGIWRRVHVIPFTGRFRPQSDALPGDLIEDVDFGSKLEGEAEGILAWCVNGCLEWDAIGLSPPSEVVAETKSYRDAQNAVKRFVDEWTVKEEGSRVSGAEIYGHYVKWCKANSLTPKSNTAFGRALGKIVPKSTSNGTKYEGIRLAGPTVS